MQCVDIAKGIGMLCIIAGHLGRPEINHVVFTFHVPLFFLIGGYFFRAAPGVSGIAKRARRLLVPYALCAVSCSLGSGLLCVLRGNAGEAIGVMKDSLVRALYGSGTLASPILGIKMFGAIWFLLAMFWALVLYDRISGHRWTSLAVLALFAVGLLTRKWWLPFSIQAGMCALLFVHVGHLARMHADRVGFRIDAISAPLVVASATAWAIAYAIGHGRFYLVQNYFECVPVDVVGAIAGTIIVLWASRLLEGVPVASTGLGLFGRRSLAVLCFHMFDLAVIPWPDLLVALGLPTDSAHSWRATIALLCMKVAWAALGVAAASAVDCAKRARMAKP